MPTAIDGDRQRRLRIVGSVAALAVLAVAAWLLWRLAGPGRDRTWERIQATGVWRVGLDPSFPPFENLDANGQPAGFDVDLAQAIAARWGVRVQFESIGFDGLLDAVYTGQIDAALSALPYQPERTQEVAFSSPYFDAGQVLVVPAAAALTLDDLAGRRLAVEWGSEGDVQARKLRSRLPSLVIAPADTAQAALQAVADGQADAALVDHVSALQGLAAYPQLRTVSPLVTSDPYVVMLPRRAGELQREVNAALEALRADGTLDVLTERWFGVEAGNQSPVSS